MPRARLFASTTLPFMLRGAMIPHAPDEEEGAAAGEETQAAPAGEEGGEETQAGDNTETAGGEETQAAGSEGEDDLGEPAPKRVPWQVKRIDKLTAEKGEIEAEAKRLREENAALKALGVGGEETTTGTTPPKTGPGTYTEDEVNRRAESIAATRVLNAKVDGLYDQVVAMDPTFTARIPQLREAVGQALLTRPDFFEVVTDLPNGAAVMNTLTKDLDRFADMLEMSPAKLGAELAMMSTKAGPKGATVSAAGSRTAPLVPVVGEGSGEMALDDPKLSMGEFAKKRAAERAARYAADN